MFKKAKKRKRTLKLLPTSVADEESFGVSTSITYGHNGRITSFAMDVLQNLLAVGYSSGNIQVFGKLERCLRIENTEKSPIVHMCFVENTGGLVCATASNLIQQWSVETGRICGEISSPEEVSFLSYVLDTRLCCVGMNGRVMFFNVSRNYWSLYEIPLTDSEQNAAVVVSVHIHPTEKNFIYIAVSFGVFVWDFTKQKVEHMFNISGNVTSFCFHPSGKYFVVGVDDYVMVVDCHKKKMKEVMRFNAISVPVGEESTSEEEERPTVSCLEWLSSEGKAELSLLFGSCGGQLSCWRIDKFKTVDRVQNIFVDQHSEIFRFSLINTLLWPEMRNSANGCVILTRKNDLFQLRGEFAVDRPCVVRYPISIPVWDFRHVKCCKEYMYSGELDNLIIAQRGECVFREAITPERDGIMEEVRSIPRLLIALSEEKLILCFFDYSTTRMWLKYVQLPCDVDNFVYLPSQEHIALYSKKAHLLYNMRSGELKESEGFEKDGLFMMEDISGSGLFLCSQNDESIVIEKTDSRNFEDRKQLFDGKGMGRKLQPSPSPVVDGLSCFRLTDKGSEECLIVTTQCGEIICLSLDTMSHVLVRPTPSSDSCSLTAISSDSQKVQRRMKLPQDYLVSIDVEAPMKDHDLMEVKIVYENGNPFSEVCISSKGINVVYANDEPQFLEIPDCSSCRVSIDSLGVTLEADNLVRGMATIPTDSSDESQSSLDFTVCGLKGKMRFKICEQNSGQCLNPIAEYFLLLQKKSIFLLDSEFSMVNQWKPEYELNSVQVSTLRLSKGCNNVICIIDNKGMLSVLSLFHFDLIFEMDIRVLLNGYWEDLKHFVLLSEENCELILLEANGAVALQFGDFRTRECVEEIVVFDSSIPYIERQAKRKTHAFSVETALDVEPAEEKPTVSNEMGDTKAVLGDAMDTLKERGVKLRNLEDITSDMEKNALEFIEMLKKHNAEQAKKKWWQL